MAQVSGIPSLPLSQIWLTSLGVVKLDPYLEPFSDSLKKRYAKAHEWIKNIDDSEGGLEKFSKVCLLLFVSPRATELT